jgi:hypothetical protein
LRVTIVMLFVVSGGTLTSMVEAQNNSSSVQNQKDTSGASFSNALGGDKSFHLFFSSNAIGNYNQQLQSLMNEAPIQFRWARHVKHVIMTSSGGKIL